MDRPSITVLLPVYNAATYLRAAIDSVLAQTCRDFELLVIEDGSTDDSAVIVAGYTDARIRLIAHKQNQGLVASLNEGLADACGAYIARMDADDLMHPQRLEKQLLFLKANPDVDVVATFVEVMNADGETSGVWDTDRATVSEDGIRRMMPRTNCIAHPTVMMRASALENTRYRPEQTGAEDWDLWLRILANGHRIAKIPEALLKYRMHVSSIMGGSKATVPLERRLLVTRGRYLRRAWWRPAAFGFNAQVLYAQLRTIARRWKLHLLPDFGRAVFRVLTYSPISLLRERRALRTALEGWNGEHLFFFPYMCIGGAEQIHADILAAVADRKPLALICGRSSDRGFEDRFRKSSEVVEVYLLVHHPLTRRGTLRAIAERLNAASAPSLFSSITDTFFDTLPLLEAHVRTFHLQHAFLYQPAANHKVKEWMTRFDRVDHFIFYSSQAMGDWKRFMAVNGIPYETTTFKFLSNAVHRMVPPELHDRPGVLFVGRDSAEKRLDLFLDVAQRINSARPGAFRFTVAGPQERRVDGVTFLGPIQDVEDMSRIYADHDILVLTSSREGFPMVIMEAMAHGLAVVSTPVGDIPNRVTPDHSWLSSGSEAMSTVLEMEEFILLLGNDNQRLLRMRKAAFARALNEYGWDGFRERYRSLLMSPASST